MGDEEIPDAEGADVTQHEIARARMEFNLSLGAIVVLAIIGAVLLLAQVSNFVLWLIVLTILIAIIYAIALLRYSAVKRRRKHRPF